MFLIVSFQAPPIRHSHPPARKEDLSGPSTDAQSWHSTLDKKTGKLQLTLSNKRSAQSVGSYQQGMDTISGQGTTSFSPCVNKPYGSTSVTGVNGSNKGSASSKATGTSRPSSGSKRLEYVDHPSFRAAHRTGSLKAFKAPHKAKKGGNYPTVPASSFYFSRPGGSDNDLNERGQNTSSNVRNQKPKGVQGQGPTQLVLSEDMPKRFREMFSHKPLVVLERLPKDFERLIPALIRSQKGRKALDTVSTGKRQRRPKVFWDERPQTASYASLLNEPSYYKNKTVGSNKRGQKGETRGRKAKVSSHSTKGKSGKKATSDNDNVKTSPNNKAGSWEVDDRTKALAASSIHPPSKIDNRKANSKSEPLSSDNKVKGLPPSKTGELSVDGKVHTFAPSTVGALAVDDKVKGLSSLLSIKIQGADPMKNVIKRVHNPIRYPSKVKRVDRKKQTVKIAKGSHLQPSTGGKTSPYTASTTYPICSSTTPVAFIFKPGKEPSNVQRATYKLKKISTDSEPDPPHTSRGEDRKVHKRGHYSGETKPVQPVVKPVQPVVKPVQQVVKPVQQVVKPVQAVVKPVQAIVNTTIRQPQPFTQSSNTQASFKQGKLQSTFPILSRTVSSFTIKSNKPMSTKSIRESLQKISPPPFVGFSRKAHQSNEEDDIDESLERLCSTKPNQEKTKDDTMLTACLSCQKLPCICKSPAESTSSFKDSPTRFTGHIRKGHSTLENQTNRQSYHAQISNNQSKTAQRPSIEPSQTPGHMVRRSPESKHKGLPSFTSYSPKQTSPRISSARASAPEKQESDTTKEKTITDTVSRSPDKVHLTDEKSSCLDKASRSVGLVTGKTPLSPTDSSYIVSSNESDHMTSTPVLEQTAATIPHPIHTDEKQGPSKTIAKEANVEFRDLETEKRESNSTGSNVKPVDDKNTNPSPSLSESQSQKREGPLSSTLSNLSKPTIALAGSKHTLSVDNNQSISHQDKISLHKVSPTFHVANKAPVVLGHQVCSSPNIKPNVHSPTKKHTTADLVPYSNVLITSPTRVSPGRFTFTQAVLETKEIPARSNPFDSTPPPIASSPTNSSNKHERSVGGAVAKAPLTGIQFNDTQQAPSTNPNDKETLPEKPLVKSTSMNPRPDVKISQEEGREKETEKGTPTPGTTGEPPKTETKTGVSPSNVADRTLDGSIDLLSGDALGSKTPIKGALPPNASSQQSALQERKLCETPKTSTPGDQETTTPSSVNMEEDHNTSPVLSLKLEATPPSSAGSLVTDNSSDNEMKKELQQADKITVDEIHTPVNSARGTEAVRSPLELAKPNFGELKEETNSRDKPTTDRIIFSNPTRWSAQHKGKPQEKVLNKADTKERLRKDTTYLNSSNSVKPLSQTPRNSQQAERCDSPSRSIPDKLKRSVSPLPTSADAKPIKAEGMSACDALDKHHPASGMPQSSTITKPVQNAAEVGLLDQSHKTEPGEKLRERTCTMIRPNQQLDSSITISLDMQVDEIAVDYQPTNTFSHGPSNEASPQASTPSETLSQSQHDIKHTDEQTLAPGMVKGRDGPNISTSPPKEGGNDLQDIDTEKETHSPTVNIDKLESATAVQERPYPVFCVVRNTASETTVKDAIPTEAPDTGAIRAENHDDNTNVSNEAGPEKPIATSSQSGPAPPMSNNTITPLTTTSSLHCGLPTSNTESTAAGVKDAICTLPDPLPIDYAIDYSLNTPVKAIVDHRGSSIVPDKVNRGSQPPPQSLASVVSDSECPGAVTVQPNPINISLEKNSECTPGKEVNIPVTPGVPPEDKPGASVTDKPGETPPDNSEAAPHGKTGAAPNDTPGAAPTDKPGTAPTDKYGAAPTDELGAAPTGKNEVAPTDKLGAAPTDKPVTAPIDKSGAAPTDKLGAALTDKPEVALIDNPISTPTDKPGAATTDKLGAVSTEKPGVALIKIPGVAPTEKLVSAPTEKPGSGPIDRPGAAPTDKHDEAPSDKPRVAPTDKPVTASTDELGAAPSGKSGVAPTDNRISTPADKPTSIPANEHISTAPDKPDAAPIDKPGAAPDDKPGAAPADKPGAAPADKPGAAHADKPRAAPADKPRAAPADKPRAVPTDKPAAVPTDKPAAAPADKPGAAHADKPGAAPADKPRAAPADKPRAVPTDKPAAVPTDKPAAAPADKPAAVPTDKSRAVPTHEHGVAPNDETVATPTEKPVATPIAKPAAIPTEKPAGTPTEKPAGTPNEKPQATPIGKPAATPIEKPAETQTEKPAGTPTEKPSGTPNEKPQAIPIGKPVATPIEKPAGTPNEKPAVTPNEKPQATPIEKPAAILTEKPAAILTEKPTAIPTERHGATPIEKPVAAPNDVTLASLIEEPAAKLTEKPAPAPIGKPAATLITKPAAILIEKSAATPTEKPQVTSIEKPATTLIKRPAAKITEKPTAIPTEGPRAIPTEIPGATQMKKPAAISTKKPGATPIEKPAATLIEKSGTIPGDKLKTSLNTNPGATAADGKSDVTSDYKPVVVLKEMLPFTISKNEREVYSALEKGASPGHSNNDVVESPKVTSALSPAQHDKDMYVTTKSQPEQEEQDQGEDTLNLVIDNVVSLRDEDFTQLCASHNDNNNLNDFLRDEEEEPKLVIDIAEDVENGGREMEMIPNNSRKSSGEKTAEPGPWDTIDRPSLKRTYDKASEENLDDVVEKKESGMRESAGVVGSMESEELEHERSESTREIYGSTTEEENDLDTAESSSPELKGSPRPKGKGPYRGVQKASSKASPYVPNKYLRPLIVRLSNRLLDDVGQVKPRSPEKEVPDTVHEAEEEEEDEEQDEEQGDPPRVVKKRGPGRPRKFKKVLSEPTLKERKETTTRAVGRPSKKQSVVKVIYTRSRRRDDVYPTSAKRGTSPCEYDFDGSDTPVDSRVPPRPFRSRGRGGMRRGGRGKEQGDRGKPLGRSAIRGGRGRRSYGRTKKSVDAVEESTHPRSGDEKENPSENSEGKKKS